MSYPNNSAILKVFTRCVDAIEKSKLIKRESRSDKEFHFQNWVSERLNETNLHYETGGRNSYPDFRMVDFTEGYEVKGLAYPGREGNYDCNSQVPTGYHNGRTIFYIFGRYPSKPDGNSYPVLDLAVCHGDFLNANHEYVHKNKNVKGFGGYGDIMIRDRKMYVAPTPFGLLSGIAHNKTLILTDNFEMPGEFIEVGAFTRKEADELIVGYTFDLKANIIKPRTISNPNSGMVHAFRVWRLNNESGERVRMLERAVEIKDAESESCDS